MVMVIFGQNVLRQVVYKFRPVDEKDNSSSHLCEVDNKDHIAFFLSLRPKVYVEYIVGRRDRKNAMWSLLSTSHK